MGWNDLDADAKQRLRQDFMRDTTIHGSAGGDPASLPYISGLSLNLAVLVRNHRPAGLFAREGARSTGPYGLCGWFARRQHCGPRERYIALEDIIAERLDTLFPGMEVGQGTTSSA